MHFRCKFRHRRSIRRPRFPIRVQNFSCVDFCILYAECAPYFYFRFVWPTDLESIPHASTPTSIIPTKFEVDMTIHCRVIAFLPADTSRDFVTLTSDLLTSNSCCAWRVTWSITFFESSTLICLFTMHLTMNVIKVICENNARPCVKINVSFCACAKSRDLLKVP